MKDLKDIILEKLNYKSPITKKICKAFGLTEEDKFTDAIDIWVYDNKVKNVIFYCNNIEDLYDMKMPKSIIKLYKDDKKDLENIHKLLKNAKTIASSSMGIELMASSQVLDFTSTYGDELYAYANK